MEAELALTGGKVVTMDGEVAIAEAVAIKYGRIIKVGSSSDVEPLIDEGTKVIDLQGRTVLPGFIDSHCHMMRTGADRMIKVDLSEEAGIHSIADLVERLREKGAKGIHVVVGGVIPGEDEPRLRELGVTDIFTSGVDLDQIVETIYQRAVSEASE